MRFFMKLGYMSKSLCKGKTAQRVWTAKVDRISVLQSFDEILGEYIYQSLKCGESIAKQVHAVKTRIHNDAYKVMINKRLTNDKITNIFL